MDQLIQIDKAVLPFIRQNKPATLSISDESRQCQKTPDTTIGACCLFFESMKTGASQDFAANIDRSLVLIRDQGSGVSRVYAVADTKGVVNRDSNFLFAYVRVFTNALGEKRCDVISYNAKLRLTSVNWLRNVGLVVTVMGGVGVGAAVLAPVALAASTGLLASTIGISAVVATGLGGVVVATGATGAALRTPPCDPESQALAIKGLVVNKIALIKGDHLQLFVNGDQPDVLYGNG